MSVLADFKKFAFKGNVVDLAVAVVIGAAFSKIVTALVADLIMPLVTLATPSGDWRSSGIVVRHAAEAKDDVVLKYGDFLGSVLDFFIVAFVLFLIISKVIKGIESRVGAPAVPDTKDCAFCLEKIPLKATRCRACTSQVEA